MSVQRLAEVYEQQTLLDWQANRNPLAFGPDYDPEQDGWRYGRQALEVFTALKSGDWKTLPELSEVCNGLQSSLSARIRNIRDWMHEKNIGTIERRQRPDTRRGNIEYRMVRTALAPHMMR